MKCYRCKRELADHTKFCPTCGSPQEFTRELIDRAIGNDQAAITQLYEMTKDKVYFLIKTMISDEDMAQDLTQDTFLKAMRYLDRLNEPAAFGGWIKKIARNMTIDVLRKRKVISFSQMVSADSDEAIEIEDDRQENLPEVVIDRQETTRLIGEILDTLSAEQRVVAEMFYYDGLSVKEISQELGVNENTIKSRLKYARNKIEAGVLALEKKGTKLYGLAPIPFLLLLFRSQDAYAAELPGADGLLQSMGSANAFTGAKDGCKGQFADNKRIVQTAAKAVRTGTGTVSRGIAAKAIAGILAIAVIGTAVGIMIHKNEEEPKPVEATADAGKSIAGPEEITAEPEKPIKEPEEAAMEPEESPSEKASVKYQEILEEYREACGISDEEYLSDTEKYRAQYANVGLEMIPYHQFGELSFFYAYCDINKDNMEEMIIGSGDATEIRPVAVYAYDTEQKKATLVVEGSQLYRTTLSVMEDGTMLLHGSGGALAGSYEFYKIAENGYSAENVFQYMYEYENWEDTQGRYYNESGDLSKEECERRLHELTEIAYDWIPLLEEAGAGQNESQPSLETVDLKRYDGYSYYENDHIKYRLDTANGNLNLAMWSLTGPDVYEERQFVMELSTAEISGNIYKIYSVTEFFPEANLSFDRSESFYGIQFVFAEDTVTMDVEANEQYYAGGADDNILTGTYVFRK